MNRSMFPLAVLTVAVLSSGATYAATVNVSTQWCGGGCSEGHDDKECICTYDSNYSQSSSWAWISCEEVSCCDTNYAYCDLGYVFEGDDGCSFHPGTETCVTQKPGGGWLSCQVRCGSSGCWAPYGEAHWEVVNEGSANYCTRSNETGDWWNPWTWTTPCTLQDQSPWDDPGSGLICG